MTYNCGSFLFLSVTLIKMALVLKSAISFWPAMQVIILSRVVKEAGQPKRKSGRCLKESDQDSKHNNLCLSSCHLSVRFLGESAFHVYNNLRQKHKQRKWCNANQMGQTIFAGPTDWTGCSVWPWLALEGTKIFPCQVPLGLPLPPPGSLKCQEPDLGIMACLTTGLSSNLPRLTGTLRATFFLREIQLLTDPSKAHVSRPLAYLRAFG